jgi:hypothetical protein
MLYEGEFICDKCERILQVGAYVCECDLCEDTHFCDGDCWIGHVQDDHDTDRTFGTLHENGEVIWKTQIEEDE